MQINRAGDTLVLRGIQELTAANADQVRQTVLALWTEGVRGIEGDLSTVEIIDRHGLILLIVLSRSCRARNGRLRLVNPSPAVELVLRLTGLAGVFEIIRSATLPIEAGDRSTANRNEEIHHPETNMKKKHRFELNAPGAQKVLLAGDFTHWQESAIPMKRKNNGDWQASVNLDPGTYGYRYIVDDQWMDDPACGARAANPFGTQNSLVQVQ